MTARIKAFYPPHTKLGECPLYREENGTVHYIDAFGYSIHILPLSEPNNARVIRCPELISFMCFCEGGGYIVCYFQGIAKVGENGEWEVLQKIVPDEEKAVRRLNDGAVDSKGRLWFGGNDLNLAETHEREGYRASASLYRYDPDGTLTVQEQGGVGCANGTGWSPDDQTMYFTDSYAMIIWAYDFEATQGKISNKRIFVDRRNQIGEPDGLVVDIEGNVYTFLWGGGKVVKYSPRGELLREWEINAHRVTHGAWVGTAFDQLVLTSALTEDESKRWEGEEGGALFWVKDVGCVGMRKHNFGKI